MSNLKKQIVPAKQERSIETRNQLIEAATECFSEFGFEATSIRMISNKSGIAYQLIFYYFGSKEGLWEVVLDRIVQKVKSIYTHYFEAIKKVPEKKRYRILREYLEELISYHLKSPLLRKIITQETMANSTQYKKLIKPLLKRFVKDFTNFVNELADTGVLKNCNPTEAAMLIATFTASNTIMYDEYEMITQQKKNSPAFLKTQIDLIMKSLCGENGLKLSQIKLA